MPALSSADGVRFVDQGYLIMRGALDPRTALSPILDDYSLILDRLVDEMRRDGRLADYDPTAPFLDRVQHIYQQTDGLLVQDLNISMPVRQNLPADTPICLPPSIFHLIMSDSVLDMLEPLLGPEISANPIQHVRIKPPQDALSSSGGVGGLHQALGINRVNGLVSQTPWHQDKAVITPDADVTDMLTVWIPLTDCAEENGCLLVHPGSHKTGLKPHVTGTTLDLTIAEGHVEAGDPVAVPASPGDVLLLHPHVHHASLANRSGQVRWSLDLRYHRTGQPSGRALLPSFIARSRADPSSECRDHDHWVKAWHDAREAISAMDDVPPSNRWVAAGNQRRDGNDRNRNLAS